MQRALITLVAVIVLIMDQASKWAVVFWLNLNQRVEIDVFPPYLVFRMAWNYGMNFGLMSQDSDLGRAVLIGLALVISAWVWRHRWRCWRMKHHTTWATWLFCNVA